eukprot:7969804-Prorocentrum_lima.AAC.1
MEVILKWKLYRGRVLKEGKRIKAWVSYAGLMAIMFMARGTLRDVQYETLFQELQYYEPDRL